MWRRLTQLFKAPEAIPRIDVQDPGIKIGKMKIPENNKMDHCTANYSI